VYSEAPLLFEIADIPGWFTVTLEINSAILGLKRLGRLDMRSVLKTEIVE
jgi:hypothetical protein